MDDKQGEKRWLTLTQRRMGFIILVITGVILLVWLVETPPGILGKADAIGFAVCHRIGDRSFHIDQRQLPMCARCTGMYLGAIVGLAYQFLKYPRRSLLPPRKILFILGLITLIWGGDGFNSYLHLFPNAPGVYEPNNILRLLTGTGMGLVVSALLFPAFNQTVWVSWDDQPAIDNWRSFGVLLFLGLVVDLLVLWGNNFVLYIAALLSVIGVLILLSMVYGMVFLILFKIDNRIVNNTQLILPIMIGLTLAILQIGLIDWGRFFLTGSWGSFPIP